MRREHCLVVSFHEDEEISVPTTSHLKCLRPRRLKAAEPKLKARSRRIAKIAS